MFTFDISKLRCYGNYVLKNWIGDYVGWETGISILALAIIVLTTILILRYKRPVDVMVLCTILEDQLKQFKYILQIDIVLREKASELLKERKKKGFISKTDNFIGGGKSAIFKVNTNSVITFEIEGALKPMTTFKTGQNELKCTKIHKEVISRQIHLVPNVSHQEDHAAITFCHDGEFLYQITITDIRQEEMEVKYLMSTRSNALSYSGSAASVDNEVLPLEPLPPGRRADDDVVSVRTGQRDEDDDDNNYDEADGGNIRRRNPSSTSLERAGSSSFEIPQAAHNARNVLTSRSLTTLSDTLGPIDAKKLLKQLNMTDAEIKFEFDNHPRDSAHACANLFNKWRSKEIERGEIRMCQELNKGLKRIGRNDVKAVFERCYSENAELTVEDFSGICH